jgi:magnesium-transporting ATPase (P-type)
VDCGDAGLSSAEAAGRLNRHELNRLTPPKPRSVLMRFLAQFNNALIYVLLVAARISLALGEVVDATVMAGVAVIGISSRRAGPSRHSTPSATCSRSTPA